MTYIAYKKKLKKLLFFYHNHHGLTHLEKFKFFDFLNFLFLYPRKGFFVLEYPKRHFPGHFSLEKKNLENWPFFDLNHGNFWTSCFYSLERRFFVLEYRKTNFPGLYCLKTEDEKMANFGPKPWVNPFAKISIFPLFEVLVFIA